MPYFGCYLIDVDNAAWLSGTLTLNGTCGSTSGYVAYTTNPAGYWLCWYGPAAVYIPDGYSTCTWTVGTVSITGGTYQFCITRSTPSVWGSILPSTINTGFFFYDPVPTYITGESIAWQSGKSFMPVALLVKRV